MAKVINCECGVSFHGETDEEVIEAAESHIEESHPDLVGAVSREDLAGWVQED